MSLLKYIFNASISEGPSESIKEEIWMNTYDVITVKVSSGETETISLLPDSEEIKFFIITSDKYSPKDAPTGKRLVYTLKGEEPDETEGIVLDIPHVLIGQSVLKKIGDFSELTIKNKIESEVNIKMLVGRNVVTPKHPPIASFTYNPQVVKEGDTVSLDASCSSDPDGQILNYKFTGSVQFADATKPQTTFVFPTGTESVTINLKVTDKDNLTNTKTITIPKVTATPQPELVENKAVTH